MPTPRSPAEPTAALLHPRTMSQEQTRRRKQDTGAPATCCEKKAFKRGAKEGADLAAANSTNRAWSPRCGSRRHAKRSDDAAGYQTE